MYAKKGREHEGSLFSGRVPRKDRGQPSLLKTKAHSASAKVWSAKRQKTLNCHARQQGGVGSRMVHTDGACVIVLLLLNTSTMHEEQWSEEGTDNSVG